MFEVTELPETEICPPEVFTFPFEPYSIQKDFMRALFTALEKKSIGIFESPTGTGKSLSLLCGALTWMEKHEDQRIQDLEKYIRSFNVAEEEKAVTASTNWIATQHELRKKKESVCKSKRELDFLEERRRRRKEVLEGRRKKIMGISSRIPKGGGFKEDKGKKEKGIEKEEDEFDYLLDDFAISNYSDSDLSDGEDEEEPEFFPLKIIFASRTHSQLSQFVKELKRTSFGDKVTVATLGSRQNLCVNAEVSRLKNLSLINEKCLDLQKGSKGKTKSENKKLKSCSGCPYFKQHAIEDLKNTILSEPMDIEELVTRARDDQKACPYYASRKAAKEAQLILMPYNTILHAGTRDGVGIHTEKSVLILDEAHNIIESISNMYSNQISLTNLEDCLVALKAYIQRYMARFSAKNLLQLKQIRTIMNSLKQFLDSDPGIEGKNLYTIQEFKCKIGIENLDLYLLIKFCEKYRLIFKLKGYMQQQFKLKLKTLEEKASKPEKPLKNNKQTVLPPSSGNNSSVFTPPKSNSQSILIFAEFLKSLKTGDCEGRIIIDRAHKTYKFLLLNVAPQFKDLVLSTRSIILAGGTMKPYDEITDHLLAGSAAGRITHFTCDHVIPDENLVCLTLTKGPTGIVFDFTFKNRTSSALLEELCQTMQNIVRLVPGGVVCFLPSYDYEGILYKFMQESGAFEKLDGRKKIFREPKDGNCDTVLSEYSRYVRNSSKGALLFAVVGGKLSEGINFSDDLGRCVLVVGLPYPNITSVEIQEKVRYSSASFGKEKGEALLTNMCSKAVNQSVGRAIRHANDYAAIILIDQRFARPSQQALLPNWIQQRSQVCDSFGQVVKSLAKFFSSKKQQ